MKKASSDKIAEFIFSFVFMAVGLYVFLEGRTFRGNDKYFPMIVGVLVLVTGIWIFLEDLRRAGACINLKKINFMAVGVAIAALVIYMFLFRTLGYVISTILLGIAIILGLRYESLRGTVLWPSLMVAVIYTVFKVFLKVPLPAGSLWKLF